MWQEVVRIACSKCTTDRVNEAAGCTLHRQQERRAHAEREQALRKLREVHEGDKEAGAASMEETRCQLLDRVAQLEEELAEERVRNSPWLASPRGPKDK